MLLTDSGGTQSERHFLSPAQEMGARTQNGGPHLQVLYWRAGGIHVVKNNGTGWLSWLLKAGEDHPPKSHPVTE
jgi:hypothetical protein